MKKRHLFWIIPTSFILGMYLVAFSQASFFQKYPVMDCIYNLEDSINVDNNKFPMSAEIQREYIQWRCAKETVNFTKTESEIIIFNFEEE